MADGREMANGVENGNCEGVLAFGLWVGKKKVLRGRR